MNVGKEYYKMPEKTDEEFFDDETGRRWFKTGDIGQVLNPKLNQVGCYLS